MDAHRPKTWPRIIFFALALAALGGVAPADASAQSVACPREAGDLPHLRKDDPFKMYVFGDSVMWGMGLKERNKFQCRVKEWIETVTGRVVLLSQFAHAGAIVTGSDGRDYFEHYEGKRHPDFKEINVSYPTIEEQVKSALREYGSEAKDVDLVLVDGCINDVNFRNLLDSRNDEKIIRELAECKCGRPMTELLKLIGANYGQAQILVTGYFPVVFEGRPSGAKKKDVPGTAYNRLTRGAIEILVRDLKPDEVCSRTAALRPPNAPTVPEHCRGVDRFMRCLEDLSNAWYESSNEQLAAAVRSVNGGSPKPRAHFVEINMSPEFGFSTERSMLWNFRFGSTGLGGLSKALVVLLDIFDTIDPNDERVGDRVKACDAAHKFLKAEFKREARGKKVKQDASLRAFKSYVDNFKRPCIYGSLGHPNRFGAALYAQAIIGQLRALMTHTDWLKRP